MKKIIKICVPIILFMVLVIGFFGYFFIKPPKAIKVPNQNDIYAFEYSGLKSKASGVKEQIHQMLDGLKTVEPMNRMEARTIQRRASIDYSTTNYYDYIPIVFYYGKDKKAQTFYFFGHKHKWYMQTENGDTYKNADFIAKLWGDNTVSADDYDKDQKTKLYATEGMSISPLSDAMIQVMKESTTFGVTYEYVNEVEELMQSGFTQKEAMENAKETLLTQEKIYQYAYRHRYKLSNKQKAELKEGSFFVNDKTPGYKDLKQKEKENGLSDEILEKKGATLWNKSNIIMNFQMEIYQQFKDGKAELINGKEAWAMDEYYTNYLLYKVFPESKKYNLDTYKKELDKAQDYYKKYDMQAKS